MGAQTSSSLGRRKGVVADYPNRFSVFRVVYDDGYWLIGSAYYASGALLANWDPKKAATFSKNGREMSYEWGGIALDGTEIDPDRTGLADHFTLKALAHEEESRHAFAQVWAGLRSTAGEAAPTTSLEARRGTRALRRPSTRTAISGPTSDDSTRAAAAVVLAARADCLRRVGHHHSESSLDSIARRCSREQVSQKVRGRPFSTAMVQVRVVASSSACLPQKSQVFTPAYAYVSVSRTTSPKRSEAQINKAGYDEWSSYPASVVTAIRSSR